MESCKKELNILDGRDGNVVLTLYCCQGKDHDGEHEWHIWTDADNEATNKKGLIKIIH